ncbi:MAG: AAA family ATPase [Pseudohongiella sp.]|nr:AAA family ATPase [Pseudohongiella sp.]
MITKIDMDAVASFRQATSLATDKKINLVYGLNGTGKSTISNFLYDPHDPAFAHCKKTLDQTPSILVYNQKFVRDIFYVADNLKGIFSLSKENKAAEQKIAEGTKKQTELELALDGQRKTKELVNGELSKQKQQAVDEVWKIKQTYSGGDRVLEYCLEGLMGQKDKLFAHLQGIPKPSEEPTRSIQIIRKEVEELQGTDAQPQLRLEVLSFHAKYIESDKIFSTSILGNSDSEVAALIEELGNSDWVKQGLDYLPDNMTDSKEPCPFCQENTISGKLIESIKSYFDGNYQEQIATLEKLRKLYQAAIDQLPKVESFTDHAFASERKSVILSKYQLLKAELLSNFSKIEEKARSPKVPIVLTSSSDVIANFNAEIAGINLVIDQYNEKLKNRESALKKLKDEFWRLQRWTYDQTMSRFERDFQSANIKSKDIDDEIEKLHADLIDIKEKIVEAQKQTVNVDEAVVAINAGLLDLGIEDFCVRKHSENLYRVVRADDKKDAFHSLSEGEKMMISFLYFCELCKGKLSADDTNSQRIVVIDDPISSLSHVFIFNVGQLIRSVFFRGDRFAQVIVLTHSLYFFYELTDTNHERRENTQKLFRISKPSSGSVIQEMKYEEIQNDYQAYWSVVNDPSQPHALIANCMRNIVEYFFNFVRKKDLNNVFQMPELQDVKYQAFCRYINRESHSLGQNIIDLKEFNYDNFKEGLRLLFEKTQYLDHFKAMSKC